MPQFGLFENIAISSMVSPAYISLLVLSVIISLPSNGSASITDGALLYTPSLNYSGNDIIEYVSNDFLYAVKPIPANGPR